MRLLLFLMLTSALIIRCGQKEASQQAIQATKVSHQNHSPSKVSNLKITTLSTMLANRGIGEWGYSALVEADGRKILFDTGGRPETVFQNASELGVDLSDVEDVFLSHNHGDHTGGLVTLRRELKQQNPKAMSRIHVGKGIFYQRVNAQNRMQEMKKELEADGVEFIVYSKTHELFPGVWITGPIERIHDEKNYGSNWKILTDKGMIEDNIPEDQSLVIDTEKGFVMIAGCGHAGMVNTLEHIQSKIYKQPIFATIGGFHLVNATDNHLKWTAEKMEAFGVNKIIGAHCTGINALYMLREFMSLGRGDAVVGSIGDSFDLETGISPTIIAK